jgi:NAD-dependent deacetylase
MSETGHLIAELAERVRRSSYTLAFTGAGISTGSGIPDYRGPHGLWRTWRPVYYHEFLSDGDARVRHWEFKVSGWRQFRDATPNPAHRALAEMERRGFLQMVVTQNIDGLHLKAGHAPDRVIELHGTNLEIECVACHSRYAPDPFYEEFERTRQPPTCPRCRGWCKPATVSFGQQLPEGLLDRALGAAKQSDVILAIGSTLEVYPAASVPLAGKSAGAYYAIINQGPTGHDSLADLRIEGDATQILPKLVQWITG